MTDANLRALERAAATGDPSAQAAALRARMRRGELSLERVELAAYCGDAAAREVVGPQRIRYSTCRADGIGVPFDLWAKGLSRWGPQVQVRACLAAGRAAVQALQPADRLPSLAQIVQSVEGWLRKPSAASAAYFYMGVRTTTIPRLLWHANWAAWEVQLRGDTYRLSDVIRCAPDIGESQVREAMQRELIAWALGAPGRAA